MSAEKQQGKPREELTQDTFKRVVEFLAQIRNSSRLIITNILALKLQTYQFEILMRVAADGQILTLKAIKAICHHVDAGILQVRGNLRDKLIWENVNWDTLQSLVLFFGPVNLHE